MRDRDMPFRDCHSTVTCPFYANWLDYHRDPRTEVIVPQGLPENIDYGCLTLIALEDAETGIPIGEELADELSEPERLESINCPLKFLNNPDYLENKVIDLLKLLKK